MDSFLIKGGVPLHGTVEISGSKNAALPHHGRTLLTEEPCVIRRVPDLSDTRYMVKILESLGASASLENGALRVHAKKSKGMPITISCVKCAVPSALRGPCWGACGKREFHCPAAASSARARSISI